MWEYFGPDIALDVVKGLVAGGASLGFQAVAPRMLRALKRLPWIAWKGAQDKQSVTAMSLTSSHAATRRSTTAVRRRVRAVMPNDPAHSNGCASRRRPTTMTR
jgi:hypothetical protein